MAKGKKTIIKEIKLLEDDIVSINGKEYVVLEDTEDIETATIMKISSNGNRILRFKDESKKARIDVKREINIVKYTINDQERAKLFQKGNDKSNLNDADKRVVVAQAFSYVKARKIVAQFGDKESTKYNPEIGKTVFYLLEEE